MALTHHETITRVAPPELERSTPVTEAFLHGEGVAVSADTNLPADDPVRRQLQLRGIAGEPLAVLELSLQHMAVIKQQAAEASEGAFVSLVNLGDDHRATVTHLPEGNRVIIGSRSDVESQKEGVTHIVVSDDPGLSSRHAELGVIGYQILIRDLDANGTGTYVRGAQVSEAVMPEAPEDSEPHESQLAKEVLQLPEAQPKQKVMCDGREFMVSGVIDGTKKLAVLYATLEEAEGSRVVPRLLYKSESDGGWRVTYGIQGRYLHKQAHDINQSHYVQETKLHDDILEALDQMEAQGQIATHDTGEVMDLFSLHHDSVQEVATAPEEIQYFQDETMDQKMTAIRRLMPGKLGLQE